MKAEAANEIGEGATAEGMLEIVRARARGGNNAVLPHVAFTSKDQMRTAIKNERRWEFAMEGYRFYDLVRWGDAQTALGSLGYTNRARYYPQDHAVTPATPLRFYVSFDSTSPDDKQINIRFKDSISGYPSFFPDKSITIAPGIHGTAVQLSPGNAIKYVNANDFAKAAQSFSMSIWLKSPGVPHVNPQFVMSLVDKDFWHDSGIFLLFDHDQCCGGGSQVSTVDS